YGEILTSEAATLPVEEIAELRQVIYQSRKRLEHLVENFLIFAQLELMGSDSQKLNSLLRKQTRAAVALIEKQARDQAHLEGRLLDLDLDVADVPVPMSE